MSRRPRSSHRPGRSHEEPETDQSENEPSEKTLDYLLILPPRRPRPKPQARWLLIHPGCRPDWEDR